MQSWTKTIHGGSRSAVRGVARTDVWHSVRECLVDNTCCPPHSLCCRLQLHLDHYHTHIDCIPVSSMHALEWYQVQLAFNAKFHDPFIARQQCPTSDHGLLTATQSGTPLAHAAASFVTSTAAPSRQPLHTFSPADLRSIPSALLYLSTI